MRSLVKIIVLTNMLLVFQLLSPLSAQTSSASDYLMPTSLWPNTSVYNNLSATEKKTFFARMQPVRRSNIAVKENEDGAMAMKYLYTKDDSLLTSFSCRQHFYLPIPQGTVPADLQAKLSPVTSSLINTVNFLNLIFQASELRETSVQENLDWYHALVRSMLVSEKPSLVRHARLRFDADPKTSGPQLVLQASRTQTMSIYLQDLTSSWKSFQLLGNGSDPSWSLKPSRPPILGLSKQVLVNDLSTLDTPKWAHGGTYVTNGSGLQWGIGPFLECKDGRFLPEWLLTISLPFYGLKPDLSPEFRGVIQVDVNIQGFDVNQCNTGTTWYADTHECNQTSMECEQIPGQGFQFGQYCCRCKEGYYSLPSVTKDQITEISNSSQKCHPEMPVCLPCWPGCTRCKNGAPCWAEVDWLLRAAMLSVQGFFMALLLLIMIITYKFRKTKRIRTSGLLLLEIVLFGALLLYFPVFILCFKASVFRCILLRWVRLLGFTVVYGTVTLKMYRLLNVLLSCTAQRVLHMSNASVLRILGVMLLIANWFLCAWTAGILQNRDGDKLLLFTSTTLNGQSFKMCYLDWWDYLMALAELLFLSWGSLRCGAVKSLPSAFHEPRYMGIAIHNELFFSAIFHLLRFTWTYVHPDWMLSLFFVHTHATITVTLCLLFIPKFLYVARPVKEDPALEMYEDEVDLRQSYIHLNSSFTSTCWSDNSLDPDDIRNELKKLYAQLEIQKLKQIANNNPHLQKKRLTFGRSLIKRIAEIPESMSSHMNKDTSGPRRTTTSSGPYKQTPERFCVTMRNEEAKLPLPEIKMFQSACKYIPQRDTPVNNCTDRRSSNAESIKTIPVMRASETRSSNTTPVKRASKSESIDTEPLFCRSASAHNLTIDNNFLQAVPTRIQKSYSFSERSKDHYVLAYTNSTKDPSHALKISTGTLAQAQDSKQNTILNTEDQSADKNVEEIKQKKVINSQQEPPAGRLFSSPSLQYVCPWEFVSTLPPHPHVGEHGMVSDIESQTPKSTVSCSAPASPHVNKRPISHQRFSLRSATQTLLLARRLVPGKGNGECSVRIPQIPRQAPTRNELKPRFVKQAAISLPSNDSTESNFKSDGPPRNRLWKSEDKEMEVENTRHFGHVSRQINGKQRMSLISSTGSNKSTCHQTRSYMTVPKTDLCPWDVLNQTKPENRPSRIADICPWEFNKPGQIQSEGITDCVSNGKSNSKQMQMTADLVDFCPCQVTEQTDLKQNEGCRGFNVCPTNVPVYSTLQIKPDSVQIPSTRGPSGRIIYIDYCAGGKKLNGPVQQKTNICPCETMRNQKTANMEGSAGPTTLNSTIPPNSTADICPWDLSELPKSTIQELQSLKNDNVPVLQLESEDLSNTSVEHSRLNVKKNKTMHLLTRKSLLLPILVDDCSLKSEEPTCKLKRETEEYSTNLQEKSTARTIQKAENAYMDICPWITEMSSDSTQSNTKFDTCPYEQDSVDESETHIMQKYGQDRPGHLQRNTGIGVSNMNKEDICAYDAQGRRATRPLTRCEALCPWEIKSSSITEHKNHLDVFTWEEPILEEERDAETAAEAFIFPPDF